MNTVKNRIDSLCTLGVVFLLLLLVAPGIIAQEKEKLSFENPWMKWDKTYWPTEPVRGGYLKTASKQYIGLMNPHHWPVNDWFAISNLYEQLIYTDGQFNATVPWLLRTWDYLNPTTVVTTIQKGIHFTDGSVLDAESLKYNIDWIMDKKNGAWSRSYFKLVKSVESLDKYTLKWHFNKPWGAFAGTANYMGYILSAKALKGDAALKEVMKLEKKLKTAQTALVKAEKKAKKARSAGGKKVEKAEAKVKKARKKIKGIEKRLSKKIKLAEGAVDLDLHPIGSGPYMLEEGRPGNYLKLKRNPNWWFGKAIDKDMPYFDGWLITIIPDPTIQLANLRAGKLDRLIIAKSHYLLVKDDPEFNVYVYPEPHTTTLQFNHAKGPCRDIRVRKAVSHAIDRKALLAGTRFGLGRVASSIYPGDHFCHNPNLKPVSYDPELSRKLLAEAGHEGGLTLRGSAPNDTSTESWVSAAKEMLSKVGINWEVQYLDVVANTDRLRNLEYDLCAGGWPWIWDPDTVATGLYHPDGGFNFGRSVNQNITALIDAGLEETDPEKRKKIYWDLDKALYDNYEDVWLWWDVEVTVYHKKILGYNHEWYLGGREAYENTHHQWFKDGR